MNAKYPEAYGTCYKTATERIIGLRSGFVQHWFVGYVDNISKRKGYPFFKVTNSTIPELAQAELDAFAKEKGWKVAA